MSRTALRRPAAFAALLLLLCGLAAAQEREPVELSEGSVTVSFEPPPGCRALSEEKMAEIARTGFQPKYVCAAPDASTFLFVSFIESTGSKNSLSDAERGFTDGQKQNAGISSFERRVVKMSGAKWVNLRYRSSAGGDRMNDVYMTEWVGEIVMFVFSAPEAKYEAARAALASSAKSIELGVSVIAPVAQPTPAAKKKN